MKQLLTNYPLFPSEYGKAGPFRKVTVIDYDGNKYCYVVYDGMLHAIKLGYLYRSRRKRMVKHETMCRWFNKNP